MQNRCVGEFQVCRVESVALSFLPQTIKFGIVKLPRTRVIGDSSWVLISDVENAGIIPMAGAENGIGAENDTSWEQKMTSEQKMTKLGADNDTGSRK